jgi:hypothetical protein
LGHHGGKDGKAYRRAFDALTAEFGPLESALVRFEAGRVAMLRVELEAAAVALMEARRKRRVGKGRRPNTRLIEQLARRAGLADGSYATALSRLQELIKRNGHSPATPSALLSTMNGTDRRRATEAPEA